MEYLIVSNTRKHVETAVPRKRGGQRLSYAVPNRCDEGDDIGLEIVPRTVTIMRKRLSLVSRARCSFPALPVGWSSYLEYGHTLPQTTLDGLEESTGSSSAP